MTDELRDRTVLLTGASGGIGAVTARTLLEQGAYVIAHYGRDRAGAEAACAGAGSDRFALVQGDLAQAGGGRAVWREALRRRDRVDVVVLNAGVMPETPLDGPDEAWDAGWERAMRVNAIEPASLAREAVAHFLEQGTGSIVAISSWAAQRGSAIPQLGAYASSKAALHTFVQTLARNHARDRIWAYVVAPGIVRTPMSEISATHRGGIDAVNAMLAAGEMVDPAEVARIVAFLATGSATHLTGATLDVNGATNVR